MELHARVPVVLISLAVSASAPAGDWTVTVLPHDGWSESHAYGTAATEHVGSLGEPGVGTFATLWPGSGGEPVDLNPSGATFSQAFATTGEQQVGHSDGRAALWTGSAESFVDLHPPGADGSRARAIADGVQAGFVFVDGSMRAALWSGTAESFVDLHPAGAEESGAVGVAGGQQVGVIVVDGSSHAALWTGSAESVVDLHPGGDHSVAFATDGSVQVGFVSAPLPLASIWFGTSDSHVDLNPEGMLRSTIAATTGAHHAGWVGPPPTGEQHAAVWHGNDGTWVDLHGALPPGVYRSSQAESIAERDGTLFVAGYAVRQDTHEGRAILWTAPVPAACPADIDGNGAVDFDDLLRILDAWGNEGGPEDLDGSGVVDFQDIVLVLAAWGPCK